MTEIKVKDFVKYFTEKKFVIDTEVIQIISNFEEQIKTYEISNERTFLKALIESSNLIQNLLSLNHRSISTIQKQIEQKFSSFIKDENLNSYENSHNQPYSNPEISSWKDSEYLTERIEISYRQQLRDNLIIVGNSNNKLIDENGLIEAFLFIHDIKYPFFNNKSWADSRLHLAYNSLVHPFGYYFSELDIKFQQIRRFLNRNILYKTIYERQDFNSKIHSEFKHYIDMNRRNVFIGCSVEGLPVAYAIQENLEHYAEVTVWDQGVFNLSSSTMESLMTALDDFQYGIFVFHDSDTTISREKSMSSIRDNVIFETGLFIGKLGKEKVYMVQPDNSDLKIPSDLLGITIGKYKTRNDSNLNASLGPFCNKVRKKIDEIEQSM